jgi:hypothetical protein
MAIQFACPGCQQPIEVDDTWAQRQVACPYCRRTITAPAASTIEPGALHQASPLREVTASTASPAPPGWATGPSEGSTAGRGVATAALALALAALALCVASKILIRTHLPEIQPMLESVEPGTDILTMQKKWIEHFESQGGIPGWMIALPWMLLGSFCLWLPGLICAILGVRHPAGRNRAVAALVLCAIVPVLTCCIM